MSRCVPACAGITINIRCSQKTASSLRPPEWTKCRLCRKLKMNTYFLETGYGTVFVYCVTKILVFITHDLFVLLANTSLLLNWKLLKVLLCVWTDYRICLPLECTRSVLVQLHYEAFSHSYPSQLEPKCMKNMKVLLQEEVKLNFIIDSWWQVPKSSCLFKHVNGTEVSKKVGLTFLWTGEVWQ